MIPKNRIPFELAKLLKDKGFPQSTAENGFAGPKYSPDGDFTSAPFANGYAAPFIWDALEWLREERNVHINVLRYPAKVLNDDNQHCKPWYAEFTILKPIDEIDSQEILTIDYDTFEEANIGTIEYVLKNII